MSKKERNRALRQIVVVAGLVAAGALALDFWLSFGNVGATEYEPYPYMTGLTTGTQVSSTYEGRHITILESNLTYYDYDSDTLVEKGDPVLVGTWSVDALTSGLVGVSFRSAAAATEYIAIDTEGIWNLPVFTTATINIGQRIYISNASGQLSTSHTAGTWLPFGWALAAQTPVTSTTYVIPVKVHSD